MSVIIEKNFLEAAVRFELTNKGFADLRLGPLGNAALKKNPDIVGIGAGNGTRTRDINLGKVALYQLSYSRINSIFLRTFKNSNSGDKYNIGMCSNQIKFITKKRVRLAPDSNITKDK